MNKETIYKNRKITLIHDTIYRRKYYANTYKILEIYGTDVLTGEVSCKSDARLEAADIDPTPTPPDPDKPPLKVEVCVMPASPTLEPGAPRTDPVPVPVFVDCDPVTPVSPWVLLPFVVLLFPPLALLVLVALVFAFVVLLLGPGRFPLVFPLEGF